MCGTQFFLTPENMVRYTEELKNRERADATIEKYVRDIGAFACFLAGAEVTKQAAIEWREHLCKTHAAASVNAAMAAINGYFDFFELGLKVKPIKTQRRIFLPEEKELTEEEYKRLLEAAYNSGNIQIGHIMQTICSTGIRVGELKFITLEAVFAGQAEVRNKGKVRVILLPDDLKTLLLGYAKEQGIVSGCIFVTKNNRPICRSTVWAEMKNLSEVAGVPKSKVFPHNLRKLFARTFYAKEKDIVKLADMLGHSDVNTTRIYTMGTGREHRRIINSLGLVVLAHGIGTEFSFRSP